jgi:CdiI immunity protein
MKQHHANPKQFPHLAEFARGYLHEDVIPEHGSAVAAAKAYINDLSLEDRRALSNEVRHFRAQHLDFQETSTTFGAAWKFTDQLESNGVLDALESAVHGPIT